MNIDQITAKTVEVTPIVAVPIGDKNEIIMAWYTQ
jgi:hypothetical protein